MLVVVGLHIDGAGRMLVQERPPYAKRAGLWEFPGGKVEKGEKMRGALAREWREEMGLYIQVGDLITEAVIEFEDAGTVLLPLFRVYYAVDAKPEAKEGQKFLRVNHDEMLRLPGVPTMAAYADAVKDYLERMV